MTYHELLRLLAPVYGPGEGRAIARLVLEERFGMSLADIACGKVTQLSADEEQELRRITVRLQSGEPVQHILGYADFCSRRYRVTPATLIPRPETERLAELAADECSRWAADAGRHGTPPRLLDIGTGTGCIAITVALTLQERGTAAAIEALDISPRALAVARYNAASLGATVAFRREDILSPAPPAPPGGGRYTAIVSNPPYVCLNEAAAMERHVLDREPHEALFVPDDDPLRFYRAIAAYARRTLAPGGALLFELNRAHAEDTAAMLRAYGFRHTDISRDIFDNPRYLSAYYDEH